VKELELCLNFTSLSRELQGIPLFLHMSAAVLPPAAFGCQSQVSCCDLCVVVCGLNIICSLATLTQTTCAAPLLVFVVVMHANARSARFAPYATFFLADFVNLN